MDLYKFSKLSLYQSFRDLQDTLVIWSPYDLNTKLSPSCWYSVIIPPICRFSGISTLLQIFPNNKYTNSNHLMLLQYLLILANSPLPCHFPLADDSSHLSYWDFGNVLLLSALPVNPRIHFRYLADPEIFVRLTEYVFTINQMIPFRS